MRRELGMLIALVLMCIALWTSNSDFLGASNIVNTTRQISMLGIFAIGIAFVIITGGIDLSIGFIMGLSAVAAAHGANLASASMPLFPAMLLGVVVGVAVAAIPGVVNGLLISKLRVPPFIGTLGMYGVARGAAFLLAGGTTVPVSNSWFSALGNGRILGVPTVVAITILFLILMHYLLSQTRFGQHTYAIGASEQAALLSGINVKRHLISVNMLSGFCAAVGGIIYTARYSAGAANAGESMLLDAIAAVVIGGASLFGGTGTVIGTLIGSLIIAVIQFGLIFIDIDAFWQFIAVGAVIILSVLIDQYKDRLARSA